MCADRVQRAHISSFGSALGDKTDLGQLYTGSDPGLVDELRHEGFRWYRSSGVDPLELAAESMRETLRCWAREVDLVVYCTNTQRSADERSEAPACLLERVGLARAGFFGVGFTGCANAGTALRVAASHVVAGAASAVLVVTSDAWRGSDRLVEPAAGVVSDGAASCVVSAYRPSVGFRIDDIEAASAGDMHTLEASGAPMALTRATLKALRNSVRTLYARGGTSPTQVRHLVTSNLRAVVLRLYAQAAGVPDHRLFAPTAFDASHCHAADPLLNLAALQSALAKEPMAPEANEPGAPVLTLASGWNSWIWLALTPLSPLDALPDSPAM